MYNQGKYKRVQREKKSFLTLLIAFLLLYISSGFFSSVCSSTHTGRGEDDSHNIIFNYMGK